MHFRTLLCLKGVQSCMFFRSDPLPCCAAVVLFVLTLQKEQYGYQFRQFAWTHLIVFFTVLPSSFFVPLMFEGLVWFCLPSALIMVNDIMAYLAGMLPSSQIWL